MYCKCIKPRKSKSVNFIMILQQYLYLHLNRRLNWKLWGEVWSLRESLRSWESEYPELTSNEIFQCTCLKDSKSRVTMAVCLPHVATTMVLWHTQISLRMMTSSNGNIFRVTGPLCGEFAGHRWIPLTKGQWRGALMFSLICAWTNSWVNNWDAGDLRRQRSHYYVTVMNASFYLGYFWSAMRKP